MAQLSKEKGQSTIAVRHETFLINKEKEKNVALEVVQIFDWYCTSTEILTSVKATL